MKEFKKTTCIFVFAFVLAITTLLSNTFNQQYQIVDLGTLGGTNSYAYSVNNLGLVVGDSLDSNGDTIAFLYENGSMINLGTLYNHEASGNSINYSGVVVGTLINDPAPPYRTGVIFENLNVASLGYPNNVNHGRGINDNGLVLATYDVNGGRRSYLYQNGAIINWNLADYQGKYLIGTKINNDGDITGNIRPGLAQDWHAFAYLNGTLSDLGTLGGSSSQGRGINESKQIVGHSLDSSGVKRAYIWDNLNGMVDLNTLVGGNSGWLLQSAADINDSGEIVGYGEINGETHAFLLKNKVLVEYEIDQVSHCNDVQLAPTYHGGAENPLTAYNLTKTANNVQDLNGTGECFGSWWSSNVDRTRYFQWGFDSNPGVSVTIDKMSFTVIRYIYSNFLGPEYWELSASTDGFATSTVVKTINITQY